jgi:threonine dehydrogenase-like Zn-dependent dehydrogenase
MSPSAESDAAHQAASDEDVLELIMEGKINTTDIISHRLPLEDAAAGYRNFKENQNEWTKVVLKPG